MIGTTVGKYRFVDILGRGGMGTVYRAVDETLDREVAIKVLNGDLLQSDGVKRFRSEAVTLAKLNHPRIAHLYELSQDADHLLMVMELVHGDTFETLIANNGAMPPTRAVALTSQVLEALQYAHSSGIVHRDLKPANLMLSSGDVKVMDFGIARMPGTEHLTQSGYMMGTPAYMAPEQVRGEDVDARTDVYAMGVVLYRMVTGELPFKADSAVVMIQKQLNDQPTPSRKVRADVPEWLDAVLSRALEKSPAARFQSADEFRRALVQGLSGTAMGATGIDAVAPTLRPTPTPAMAAPVFNTDAIRAASSATSATRDTGSRPAASKQEAGPTTVTLKQSQVAGAAALVGALVIAVGLLAFFVMRGGKGSTDAPASNLAAVASPAQTAQPTSSPDAQPPAAALAQPVIPPPPAAPPVPPSRTASAAAAPAPPAAVRAEPPTVAASPSAPVTPPRGLTSDPALTFKDVKIVFEADGKPKEEDVVLTFADGRLTAAAAKEPAHSRSMSYRSILTATYAQSKHPRWKQGVGVAIAAGVFAAPLFFMKSTRHWLTLQSNDDFMVLHLDKDNVSMILPALESRAGITIERLAGDK